MKHSITIGLAAIALTTVASGQTAVQQGGSRQVSPTTQGAPSPKHQLDETVVRLEARTGQDSLLYAQLVDLLRLTPNLMQEIPGLLRSGKASLSTSDTLIFSLEDIGTDEAQQLLASIHLDPQQRHMDRLRAVMALGAQDPPTEAALGSLWVAAAERYDPRSVDLSNTALLALGIAGSGLRVHAAPGYAGLRDGLLNRLSAAWSSPERSMILKAVGNLHDAALGDEVAMYLLAESAPVRASAAQSLGMLGDASKRSMLTTLLPVEPHGAVRAAIADALRELPADESSLRAVLGIVRYERNEEARALMVSYLVEHLREFEEGRATLREMTRHDPSNRVRILASSSLR